MNIHNLGVSQKLGGTTLGGPNNEGLSYFGVYIGVPLFGETTILALGVIHGQIKGLGLRV